MTLELLVGRIRGEFLEMPGLRLTFAQACRLWQVDGVTCQAVLDALVTEGFLSRTADGAFVAAATFRGRLNPAKAALSLRNRGRHSGGH